jgi:tight adherence protein C
MNAGRVGALALLLAALGVALLAVLACQRLIAARRTTRTLEQRFAAYNPSAAAPDARAASSNRAAMGGGAPANAAGASVVASGGASVGGSVGMAPRTTTVAAGASAMHAAHAMSGAPTEFAGRASNVPSGELAGRASKASPAARARGVAGFAEALAQAGMRWFDTPAGRLIVAEEDRRLLDQCGFVDARSRGLFLIARLAAAIVFGALAAWWTMTRGPGGHLLAFVAGGAIAGFMAVKLALRRRASSRLDSVANELPMFVDLLRLLQGVGLSLDQSLQVMVNEFRRMLPVLASEMEIAQRQFVAGRTREQSLQRMGSIYDNDDLRAVIRLIVQVDRHGGAVQEPLKQFGERLREVRRATLRERIGRLTVKLTGVMVVTLLPALLIATAGPGVIAVLHALSTLHH